MTIDRGGSGKPLPRSFYRRSTLTVARDLLGKVLLHAPDGECLLGRIVEVEAYCGPRDRAAHSRGGHRSARNESMWGPPGHAYVYLIYGVHHCLNVVTREAGVAEAVLIRAIEPLVGIDGMRRRRDLPAAPAWRLCRGPGSLCRAFGIDRSHDAGDLVRGPVRILDAPPVSPGAVRRAPRIGVAYAGPDAARPWRFLVAGSRAVSVPPPT